jgi:hypothetical protein
MLHILKYITSFSFVALSFVNVFFEQKASLMLIKGLYNELMSLHKCVL